MIRYLKRKELDTDKYDLCIEKAINSRVYAFSWYLDIVADNWDVLVLDDYKAVMPLPWRKKYLIKYIYPPVWTQQLGVFSANKIDSELVKLFLNSIPKMFRKITIQLNSGNKFIDVKEGRDNYILSLDKSSKELYDSFNKNRKRVLKKARAANWEIDKALHIDELLEFYNKFQDTFNLSTNHLQVLAKLIDGNRECLFMWGVRKDNHLIACMVWMKSKNRLIYLVPSATRIAKKAGLPSLLIYELINQFSNSNYILDFEGSMIPGVASFYRSFGADTEKYNVLLKYFF